jgi:hypothetical protein
VESSRLLKLAWSTRTGHGAAPIAKLPRMLTLVEFDALDTWEVPPVTVSLGLPDLLGRHVLVLPGVTHEALVLGS